MPGRRDLTDALLQPFESIMPIISNPHLNPNKPLPLEVAAKLKNLLMAIYFAGDHVVWAGQAGLITNKETLQRCDTGVQPPCVYLPNDTLHMR